MGELKLVASGVTLDAGAAEKRRKEYRSSLQPTLQFGQLGLAPPARRSEGGGNRRGWGQCRQIGLQQR